MPAKHCSGACHNFVKTWVGMQATQKAPKWIKDPSFFTALDRSLGKNKCNKHSQAEGTTYHPFDQ